jgi:hypothetical protein
MRLPFSGDSGALSLSEPGVGSHSNNGSQDQPSDVANSWISPKSNTPWAPQPFTPSGIRNKFESFKAHSADLALFVLVVRKL